MTLLTAIEPTDRHTLTDAVRAIAWSPTGRVLSLGADGRAARGADSKLTAPIGPDPITACWLTDERVAVLDGCVGLVMAGGGAVSVVPSEGMTAVLAPNVAPDTVARASYCVAVGATGLLVIGSDPASADAPTTIPTGSINTAHHLGGAIWATGGAAGLCIVDVALGVVDQRVELPGVVAIAASPAADRLAVSDATGAIHVLELARLDEGIELTGYPDAVRRLGMSPLGDLVVACADDEVTWWAVSPDGSIADAPECSVGHDVPITVCDIGSTGFVATGDEQGVVRLWSPRMRDVPVSSLHLDGEITVLAWSPWGERLAIGTVTGEVVLADISAGELL